MSLLAATALRVGSHALPLYFENGLRVGSHALPLYFENGLRVGSHALPLYFENGLRVGSSRGRNQGACRVVAIAKFPKRIVPITCSQSG